MSQDGWPPPTTPTSPPAPPPSGPPTTPLSPPPPVTAPPTVPYSTPPPAVQEPENRARGLVIGAVVAVLALAGVVVFLLTRDGDDDDASSVPDVTIPAATQEPTGLGDDEGFNALAADCYGGDMAACDELYNRAEDDSAYRRYGDTCAGRQPENTRQFCTATFPD